MDQGSQILTWRWHPECGRRRYRKLRYSRGMTNLDACVLQAVMSGPGIYRDDIIQNVGYSASDSRKSFNKLRSLCLIERIRFGEFIVTDKGKIALAIWRGKQIRQRMMSNAA